jgi:16S rRNA (cytosine1402-N4)-methyltransferase
MAHIPVLLHEVMDFLHAKDGTKFIDGTAGDGGYIKEILKQNPKAHVLGIDLDQTSLDKLTDKLAQDGLGQRVTLAHGNFRKIKQIATENNFGQVDAVILDLGFSSSQLDQSARGLSFQESGPLDMRFDLTQEKTADKIINKYPQKELVKIFREYGEEHLADKIAFEITKVRGHQTIATTKQLYEVIAEALPKPVKYKANDFARRVFQALRIEVNDELNNLKRALPDILELLAPGGRMLIISFHSLEDRIVKEFMVSAAKGCICPPDFPTCVCGKKPLVKMLTKKPITASETEIEQNSRSKPAKLRVAEKLGNETV